MVLALLAAPCSAQQWTETDVSRQRAKLDEYISYRWTDDEIVAGLSRWFGYNFEIPQGGRAVYIVLRHPNGVVYFMQFVGTLPPT